MNFNFTSNGAGSFAENAPIERRFSVGSVNADSEDEEGSDDGKNKTCGHHCDDFGL